MAHENETDGQPDVMVKVDGKPFRCTCGGNVFRHPKGRTDIFICNSCGEAYLGE